MKIVSARTAAPSFNALRLAGYTNMPRRGQPPTHSVVVARDEAGRTWQHQRLLPAGSMDLVLAVRAKMEINPAHWRLTSGEY